MRRGVASAARATSGESLPRGEGALREDGPDGLTAKGHGEERQRTDGEGEERMEGEEAKRSTLYRPGRKVA